VDGPGLVDERDEVLAVGRLPGRDGVADRLRLGGGSSNSAYSVSRPGSMNSSAADLSQTVNPSPRIRRSIIMYTGSMAA